MDFMQKIQSTLNQGLDSSRDLFFKARERARELGDKGVLKFEIMQLENQAEKLMGKLGSKTYEVLITEDHSTVSKKTPDIRELLQEIEDVRKRIEEKEKLLKQFE